MLELQPSVAARTASAATLTVKASRPLISNVTTSFGGQASCQLVVNEKPLTAKVASAPFVDTSSTP
jgi:hypothetical protein